LAKEGLAKEKEKDLPRRLGQRNSMLIYSLKRRKFYLLLDYLFEL
jgi:hypothetical protein